MRNSLTMLVMALGQLLYMILFAIIYPFTYAYCKYDAWAKHRAHMRLIDKDLSP